MLLHSIDTDELFTDRIRLPERTLGVFDVTADPEQGCLAIPDSHLPVEKQLITHLAGHLGRIAYTEMLRQAILEEKLWMLR